MGFPKPKNQGIRLYLIASIAIAIMLLSCNSTHTEMSVENENFSKDTLVYSTSIDTLGVQYRIDYRSNDFLYLMNSKNDTLVVEEEVGLFPSTLVLKDYNRDGHLDLRYGYNSNYYFEMIWLFNPKNKSFQKIEGIDDTNNANSQNIEGTKFYYSKTPNGCGKANWFSSLFVIEDYTVVPVASMYFRQCMEEDKGIYIYEIEEGEEHLKERFSIIEADKYEVLFCDYYWRENHQKFKR